MNIFLKALLGAFAAGALAGCQATSDVIHHSDLSVQTHMSETVFLDPVPPALKTIYVSARNTSDHPEIDLRGPLTAAIAARGYRIVDDPNAAHYMLRINILQAGPIDTKNRDAMLMGRYGEPLLAGAGAAAIAGGLGGGSGAMTGAGLGVGVATFLANEMIQNVTYSVVVDIQLSERPLSGKKVKQSTSTVAHQSNGSSDYAVTSQTPTGYGTSSSNSYNARTKTQNIDEDSDFKQYQTRDIAYAEKVNLKFEEASGPLLARLTSSLSNLFE